MAIESILGALIIGAIAGWLAGKLMKGGGYGLFGNIVLGRHGDHRCGYPAVRSRAPQKIVQAP